MCARRTEPEGRSLQTEAGGPRFSAGAAVPGQAQLITYPDSLGGDLGALRRVLDGPEAPLAGLFPGGVHILPPFPSSGDRGFAPLTYAEIDPRLGSWQDIAAIGAERPVMLDLMANHISRQSAWFQDFLRRGCASPYADLFIPVEKHWPNGEPPAEDVERIFLRRASPFSTYAVGEEGRQERLWTTFGKQDPSEQIDLDVRSPAARGLFTETLAGFARRGVRLVRLDAVGYVVKKPGTSCFFVEPEIYDFLDWIAGQAHALGIEVLPEVHAPLEIQRRLAEHGFWIYDFVLPYRVLEALLLGTGRRLRAWLEVRPSRQFTMLDCHDGIPVKPDLNGLYDPAEVRRVVDLCLERGGNLSRVFSPGHRDPDGFDTHQIRGTLYSLLGADDGALLAARAIQLFAPGTPQVYYVGLLAGQNDQEALRRSGDGREINRRNYTPAEIRRELEREVVQRQLALIRLRNEHPAFGGLFRVEPGGEGELGLAWRRGQAECRLQVDLRAKRASIEHTDARGCRRRVRV